MHTIWKTVLALQDTQVVVVPQGSEFLCAREQNDTLAVWFRCDPTAPKERRTLWICGTGGDAPKPERARYLGTAILRRGMLVCHVFDPEERA